MKVRPLLLLISALAAGMLAARAEPVISEFMAANSATLADQDGSYSDWIEIHNPDSVPASLAGWYLTDSATNKTKWQFPAVTIPAGGYVVVFASNKNRTDVDGELHTNFALSAGGEYLALVRPDGMSVASEYAPQFPAQSDDVSYGIAGDGSTREFFFAATPGKPNSAGSAAVLAHKVAFSRRPGLFSNPFSLELSGADGNERIRYVIAPAGPAGAMLEPTAASPEYTGPIAVASSVIVRAAVFSADGSARGGSSTASYMKIGADVATFSSQLPVLVIDSLGSGELVKDTPARGGWLYAYAAQAGGGATFRGTPEVATPIEINVRGSSSADFPKRSYSVKLTNEQGDGAAQPLLDLGAYEKWALVGPWSFDFSYVNNAFMYSLSNRIGRWAARTRFTEVFVNTGADALDRLDYAGLYALTDRIEVGEGRVDIAPLSKKDVSGSALTGGYILKIDTKDAEEFGWTTQHGIPSSGTSSIVLVAPKADEVTPEQQGYIVDYVQKMEDALYADAASGWAQRTYLDYIDRASWVDFHLLNTFSANPDAFERSTYFHKDRDGKLQAGPVWDFDRALGSYWDTRSYRWEVWSGVGATDVWQHGWWGVLAQDPEFMQDWVDRWQSLRRDELSNGALASLVDSLTNSIGQDAVTRDAARWPDNVSPYGNYAAQASQLRNWVTQRAQWIDEQFVAAPAVNDNGASIAFTAPAGAQLAYTLDGSDPRSLGGDVAPNAVLTSAVLTVPSGTNVHVRSYRADLKGVFPGSPWSSAVGGQNSSPLSPRARLVNISSRAIVGSGEDALIAGVVVADTQAKRYLARAVGPGLAEFGATGIVADPQLSIYASNGVELFRNNAWETGPDAASMPLFAKSVGAFPLSPGSRDAALADVVPAGNYTVQVTTPSGVPGVGLAELYELDGNGRTVNLSTRAKVHAGDGVLIGGFVVQGPAYKRMLIRAVGPTLGAFGVESALRDPILTIYSGQNVFASNDRWEAAENVAALTAASQKAGAFALGNGSEDAALLITLPPGAYTVEVKGKGDAEGVALLEIYEVP